MVRTLSGTAIASQNAEATEEVWLVLLTLEHDDLAEPLRVVNNIESIVSNGETYVGLPFRIVLPEDSENGPGEARLQIDNVDKLIVETLRTLQSPPTMSIQVVLASQPDTVEYLLTNMTLRDASYDDAVVEGVLRFEDLTVEAVSETITPERFPALF